MNDSVNDAYSKNESVRTTSSLDGLVVALTAMIEAGDEIDLREITAEHPQHREQLEMLLPTLQAIVGLERSVSEDAELACEAPESATLSMRGCLGDFRIVRELGRGGMGVVYEAEQISLGRRVALKILPFAALLDERRLARFRNEARAAAMLKHPHIVSVFAIGHDRGVHHYAMELIEGPSLAEFVPAHVAECEDAASSDPKRSMDPAGNRRSSNSSARDTHRSASFYRRIARIGIQAAEALHYSHHEGVIHRDVKPANLLVDPQGNVHVSDFGLARIQSDSGLSATGDVVGTLRYMSPEQALGDRELVDHRTDIYSLGLTLYELLTGRPAFDGKDAQSLLRQIDRDEPSRPRAGDKHLPRDLETVVLKAIAKVPVERYRSAQEMADDLQRFLDDRPVRARRTSSVQRTWRIVKRNPIAAASIATVVLLLLTLAIAGPLVAVRQMGLVRDKNLYDYALAINVAKQAYDQGDLVRMKEVLDSCRPGRGDKDLRGFEWNYLDRLADGEADVTIHHGSRVSKVAFLPAGRHVVTGTIDGSVRLWSLDDEQFTDEIHDTHQPLRGLAVSPDGSRLATAGSEGTAKIWQLPSLQAVVELIGHERLVWSIAFSPGGTHVATASADRTVRVWDASTGARIHLLEGHADAVYDVAFSPDGTTLASAGRDSTVRIWDIRDGTQVKRLELPTWHLTLAYSMDGQLLATAGWGESIFIWNTKTWVYQKVYKRKPQRTLTVAFTQDGQHLVAGADDNLIDVFDLSTRRQVARYVGHTEAIESVALSSPDGRWMASGSLDKTMRLWKMAIEPPEPERYGPWMTAVRFAPNGNQLLSASGRMGADNNSSAAAIQSRNPPSSEARDLVSGDTQWSSVDVSRDGKILVSGGTRFGPDDASDRGAMTLLSLPDGELIEQFVNLPNPISAVAFHPSERVIAVGFQNEGVKLFRLDNRQWTVIAEPSFICRCLRYSQDGQYLVAGGGQWDVGELRIWDRQNGSNVARVIFTPSTITGLDYAHRSPVIATVGWRGEVGVWDARTGEPVKRWRGHVENAMAVAFSPNDRTLATGNLSTTLKLWRMPGGEALLSLDCGVPVYSLEFSPDGNLLAVGGARKQVIVLDGGERP